MRCSTRWHASVLLQHIHRSLPVLQKLYAHLPQPQLQRPAQLAGRVDSATSFPPDPQTAEEGDRVVRFFCSELGMGEAALQQWRHKLRHKSAQRWGVPAASRAPPNSPAHFSSPNLPISDTAAAAGASSTTVPWTRVRGARAAAAAAPPSHAILSAAADRKAYASSSSFLWLRPRSQDVAVVQSAMQSLQFIVSPFLLLSPTPVVAASPPRSDSPDVNIVPPHDTVRPASYEECSRWYATQPIPAGMFLMSLPTEAVLFANPPPAADPVLMFYMQVEELVGQLVSAVADASAPHHGYASYLCDSVVPSRNLPFLTTADVQQLFEAAPDLIAQSPHVSGPAAVTGNVTSAPTDSPALSLVSFFHEDMAGEPLSDYLRKRISRDEYAWWVSLVLSHRAGATSLLPMIDKLNHSPLPNCYYTMATEDTMCGIDVLDNLFAGVPGELLYQPYVHVFALRDIPAGAELTLCYASASEGVYNPASRHPPAPPPPLSASGREGAHHQHSSADSAKDMAEVMHDLFPSCDASMVSESDGGSGSLDCASQFRRLKHPGRQEIDTPEGKATWLLQWGFVPPCDAIYSAKDLREMATLIAERRVDMRSLLFPQAG
ncbi:hypothetical protein JKF63_06607 [Porcisia hertigi]|uniref:SET domain-containing protein n=1 Tax=Porcisia hertigi TaxID=2761500 RepID=A0A836IY50_9TRYP|nr:hypothetical protein JKF63_06607 [Porcisia hertigi]